MKEYMPYDGINDPFYGLQMAEMIDGVDEDGMPLFSEKILDLNPDCVSVPTLPIREPFVFEYRGEPVELIADVTHNLRIGSGFDSHGEEKDRGMLRLAEFEQLFSELAVAWYAYGKRDIPWQN